MPEARGNLLIELLTEELPPKALKQLSQSFASSVVKELEKQKFLSKGANFKAFATPRRLAVQISNVRERSPDEMELKKGPAAKDAYNTNGEPTNALLGFLKKWNVGVEAITREKLERGEVVVAHVPVRGRFLDEILAKVVEEAVRGLPAPKVMRWGDGQARFVRPVHGLVMMFDSRVISGSILGLQATNVTQGHRFMSDVLPIKLLNADDYEQKLLTEGNVIVSFERRRAEIERQLMAEANKQQALLGNYDELLDEVTALVEKPSVYIGHFDPSYLEVPEECLILTMQKNQKYFPLLNQQHRLTSKFLIVSNIQPSDPSNVIEGNQKVVTPRLADAKFFFEQDKKIPLAQRLESLQAVTFHQKLGSQYERSSRLKSLATTIGTQLKLDDQALWGLERAALWSKCDLTTNMVVEFPELQGIMGKYYLIATDKSWNTDAVATAIEEQYRPRFSGDHLPATTMGCCLALADKLDTLIGMFGIGLSPTGEKDPFGLRRVGIGVLRILVEKSIPLELHWLIEQAYVGLSRQQLPTKTTTDVQNFIFDRLRMYLKDRGFATDEIEAVVALRPMRFDLVLRRIEAVRTFRSLPEAASLAIANKRARNIVQKANSFSGHVNSSLLKEAAEKELHEAIARVYQRGKMSSAVADYTEELLSLASLKPYVDRFFDDVLVNVDDEFLRNNRLALLNELSEAMNSVADISKLAE